MFTTSAISLAPVLATPEAGQCSVDASRYILYLVWLQPNHPCCAVIPAASRAQASS